MAKIKQFICSPFEVNTYIIYDETKECVIIDPAFYTEEEKREFHSFIKNNQLMPVDLLNTHGHVDHLLGNHYVHELYGLKPSIHEDDYFVYNSAMEMAAVFGLDIQKPSPPKSFLNEDDIINFGNSKLKILHLPGHSPGSLAFIDAVDKYVVVGDVLFYGSIGRTDLPKGDHQTLISSIQGKLMKLNEEMVVYSGHGPKTTIKKEKENNPFLN